MTISTNDCKDFILSISPVINANPSDNWKRTRKYKEGAYILRDFENQDSRVLTIAEFKGQLFLYQLNYSLEGEVDSSELIHIRGASSFGKSVTEQEVFEFMAQCVKDDSSIVYDDKKTISDAINPNSWTVWEKWSQSTKTSNDYSNHPLEDFFNNHDGSYGEFDLYYPDEDGNILQIEKKDIIQIFWVGMHDYDTAYRIFVFETYDHQLWLGQNEPD